ncbi:MAG: ribosome assembly cofactor RimP, partial [Sphaerochaeta sp.]|nr:ribosome assembly cofactor RimP [Sphaerochaeta sp.]
RDGETTVDHCADVYRLVFPRLQLAHGDRDLSLEVSTPGLERSFKDIHEFALFHGKRVRLYDNGRRTWVSGIIEGMGEGSVTLGEVFVEGQSERFEQMNITYTAIQKAKLDYRWEDRRHGN